MEQKILKWLRAEDYREAIPEIRLSVALNRGAEPFNICGNTHDFSSSYSRINVTAMALIKTEFDGKYALIVGDHPHSGQHVIRKGADETVGGLSFEYENPYTGERMYIDSKFIEWVD